ncbi:large-conductance mechanosensitive channel [Bifidobacterium biavatii DSM 23969]|uniref:Large-conductance mechanosensitive channel n=1 Tax=Bifidobacterium biavatii DSM 23969 TaxID=1437608 RepID=A0A086ZSM7_9BIFI|nr:large-conductance mechanosensitive channel [Bifidobacterium biavatii DSM 23969]
MIDGFKKFISRGNMIDMAVGVVMGAAVTAVVNSIVDHLINPLIAMIFGKPDMGGLLAFTFNGATISFGAVLGALLNFLVIAVAVYFCILVPINKFRDMSEALIAKTKLKEAADKAAALAAQAAQAVAAPVLGGDKASAGEAAADAVGDRAANATAGESGVSPAVQADAPSVESSGASASAASAEQASSSSASSNEQIIALLTEIRDQLAKRDAA